MPYNCGYSDFLIITFLLLSNFLKFLVMFLKFLVMFLKFLVKQLRHWVFLGAIWLLHLGIQRKLHTKHWFVLSSSMQLIFGIPIMILRQIRWRKCRGQQPGGPAGDGGTGVASTICWTNSSGHPLRTAG